MENQTEKERIEAQIKKNEEEIKRIQAEIDKNNESIKENKRQQKSLIFKIFKGETAILINYFWFYFSNTMKIPVYILFIIYIALSMLWDKNMFAMLMNIYNSKYTRNELDIIFGHFNTLINHATFIFYIILLSCYTFLS
jgi:predicted PurR-regulated permease PerM